MNTLLDDLGISVPIDKVELGDLEDLQVRQGPSVGRSLRPSGMGPGLHHLLQVKL